MKYSRLPLWATRPSGIHVVSRAILLAILFSVVTVNRSVAYQDNQLTCQTFSAIPVTLGSHHYHIFGKLCMKRHHTKGVVQVLLSGATYTHLYWQFPYQPETYSYVDALTTTQYSTFSVDRISNGYTSRPPSALVTLDADAGIVHQLIERLRNGTLGGVHFAKVILVGHSLGSYILWDEVTTYHDVDGVIVTGALHKSSPSHDQKTYAFLYLAHQDKFQGLDDGYYTTTPATETMPSGRQALFYNWPADTDKQVIAVDDQNKDVVALAELLQGVTPKNVAKTDHITVPVLDVVGQDDFFYCAPDGTNCLNDQTVNAAEAPYYPPQACLETHILPWAGHDINLAKNAQDWFKMARTWLDKHFGDDAAGSCS